MDWIGRPVIRRWLAALLLVFGATPTALELAVHGPDDGDALHHVEAASVRHHADHCLVASIAAEKCVMGIGQPSLVGRTEPTRIAASLALLFVPTAVRGLPRTRAPPTA